MTDLFEYILIALVCPLTLPFIDKYKAEIEDKESENKNESFIDTKRLEK